MAWASLAVAAGLGVVAGSASAAFPGANGLIAFSSNRDTAAGDIYTVNHGINPTVHRITTSNSSSDPAWSPDGSRIAYVGVDKQIVVMRADGSDARVVTTSATSKLEPAWSPDGTQLLYVANSFDIDGQTDYEIWRINVDGSGRTQLTDNTAPDRQPAWSPLGDKIAFVASRTGDTNNNIYVMNADGSGEVSITPNSPVGCSPNCYQGHDDSPAWRADGLQIAYVHNQTPTGGGIPNIWLMDPDGSDKVNLGNNGDVAQFEPAWSPQSDFIAYKGVSNTEQDIYAMDATGANQAPLDTTVAKDEKPDWQPLPQCTHVVNDGNDPLVGTPGADVLCGDNRANKILGGGGNDTLLGRGGNDQLTGGGDQDIVNGGGGTDLARYPGSTAVRANLDTGFATGVGRDVLLDLEGLSGSSGNDRLTGAAGSDLLIGGKGNDDLFGLGGSDTLRSKDGIERNDDVDGGAGPDSCVTDERERSIVSC